MYHNISKYMNLILILILILIFFFFLKVLKNVGMSSALNALMEKVDKLTPNRFDSK